MGSIPFKWESSEPIMIGISPDRVDPAVHHGVIHVHGDAHVKMHGFIADDVRRLQNISASEVKDIFSQIKRMGFQPISFEVFMPKGRVVWHRYPTK